MNKSKSYVAAIGVIVMAFTLTLLTGAQQGEIVRKVSTSNIPNKQQINSLLEKLLKQRNGTLSEGHHLVVATQSRTKFYAVVRNGKVVDFSLFKVPTKNGIKSVQQADFDSGNAGCAAAIQAYAEAIEQYGNADSDEGREHALSEMAAWRDIIQSVCIDVVGGG